MSKKTKKTCHLSINQVSLSNEAKRFIAKKPYKFADRNEENLVSIRSSIRASIEPMVRRVIETYGVQISHEVICHRRTIRLRPSPIPQGRGLLKLLLFYAVLKIRW